MMKRLLFYILSCFCFVLPVSANIKIDAKIVDGVVKQHFKTPKAQASAIATLKQAAEAGDGTVSASDLWKVCVAGGLDIKKAAYKQKCEEFAYQLIKALGVDYKEVCGKDAGKTGGAEVCEKEMFKDIRVNAAPGAGLSQEYVRVKHNDDTLRCDGKNIRTEKRDDYLKCASANNKAFYEFRFDTLDAFVDDKIKSGIEKGICKIHGSEYGAGAYYCDNTTVAMGTNNSMCYVYGCRTDNEKLCGEINKTARVFGYSGKYNADAKVCEIDVSSVGKAEDLANDFAENGVDSFYFCTNAIQVTNNLSFNDAIKEYLAFEVGVPEHQIDCVKGFRTYTGKGCRTGWINAKDDIIQCSIGDKKVDFVFDDVNEKNKTRRAGGYEGVVCLAADGTFDGSRCETFTEEQCMNLKAKLAATCTDNCDKEVEWKDDACILPNAKTSAQRDKIARYALEAGIVIGAVALTVVTGGGASGVWVVVAHFGTGAMITGAVVKEAAQAKMTWGIYEPFVKKANQCFASPNDTECAERILREDLQTLMSYGDHFLKEEAHALDGIFAKLIERIPKDSQFWQDFINDEDLWNCTDTGCTLKTKHQTWEYVSQVGDALMLAGGLLHIASAIGTYRNTLAALQNRGVMLKNGMGRSKSVTQLVEPVAIEGSTKEMFPIVSNADLYNAGLTTIAGKGANADVVQKLLNAGVKVGDRITIAQAQRLLGVAATTSLNLAPIFGTAIAVMPGHGGDEGEFYIALVDDEKTSNTNQSGGGSVVPGTILDEITDTDDVTDVVSPTTTTTATTAATNTSIADLFKPDTSGSNASQRFRPQKSKNTGLVATAAVLGTVAVGGIIGGLVVASDKNDNKTKAGDVKIDSELEDLMQRTQGSFGSVGNNPLRLKTLPTVVNSNAPIVLINGYPVVLVLYKSRKIPFYMNGTSWAPLLGIGNENNYFNVYPTSEKLQNNTKLTAITNALNAGFNPAIVARYNGQVPGAVAFPTAAATALPIINSEFTNGVVQSSNMSDADRRLYNDNYNKIQEILK